MTVVGAGAIGSALAAHHLARLPALRGLTLVDPDRYDASNLAGQVLSARDMGRTKVAVTAHRVRRTNPSVVIEAIPRRIEDVPLGRLRSSVILACVDSREARCAVSRAATRLGVPWIDAGVEPHGRLARVSVFRPGSTSACYECQLSDRDYETLGVVRACARAGLAAPVERPADRVPAALGALAASLQAIELDAILAGDWDRVPVGRTITLAAADHVLDVVEIRPSTRCRGTHEPWTIERLAGSVASWTIEDALRCAGAGAAGAGCVPDGASLRVEGRPFVREVACPSCGSRRTLLRLAGRIPRSLALCRCGVGRQTVGFSTTDRLRLRDLSPRESTRSLASLGFEPGEVFTIERGGADAHYELLEGAAALRAHGSRTTTPALQDRRVPA